DAPEGRKRGLDDLIGILGLGNRERRGDRLAAGFLDLVDHRLRRPGIAAGALEGRADVAHHYARALRRQPKRNRAPDAAPRAGDNGDLVGDDDFGHLSSVPSTVIPAKAGIHPTPDAAAQWIPAFAGMTAE